MRTARGPFPFPRLRSVARALLVVGLLSGCSSTANVLAGLATPQSTISGSNYVYEVDPNNGSVVPAVDPSDAGFNIVPGDGFRITMEFGFLRYLQAVDPYVVVYARSWMGSEPEPTDPEAGHHQIVLIRDGLTPNARLPLQNVPLLGPVKLGEDLQPVKVSLTVVVLSKQDNEQTIKLLETAAGVVGTASPTATAAANAGAAVGAAIVSLNRDKIEFQHTFVFQPTKGLVDTDVDSPTIETDSAAAAAGISQSRGTLRTGRFVILKGESGYRLVPWEHSAFYLWPTFWFGHAPDPASVRYEASDSTPTIDHPLNAPGTIAWYILSAPFHLVRSAFSPQSVGSWTDWDTASHPEELTYRSQHLAAPVRKSGAERAAFYAEKTHFVIGVEQVDATLDFAELREKYSAEAERINELTTNPEEARQLTDAKIDAAADAIRTLLQTERVIAQTQDAAEEGIPPSKDDLDKIDDDDAKKAVMTDAADTAKRSSVREFVAKARKLRKKAKGDDTKLGAVVGQLADYIGKHKWEPASTGDDGLNKIWSDAWSDTVKQVEKAVRAFGNDKINAGFDSDWPDDLGDLPAPDGDGGGGGGDGGGGDGGGGDGGGDGGGGDDDNNEDG